MAHEMVSMSQSSDFLCPNCGSSGFEIIGTEQGGSRRDAGVEKVLVLECLRCEHVFRHRCKGRQKSLAHIEC